MDQVHGIWYIVLPFFSCLLSFKIVLEIKLSQVEKSTQRHLCDLLSEKRLHPSTWEFLVFLGSCSCFNPSTTFLRYHCKNFCSWSWFLVSFHVAGFLYALLFTRTKVCNLLCHVMQMLPRHLCAGTIFPAPFCCLEMVWSPIGAAKW